MTEKELRKQEIAQKIKNLRIASGLTQLQVAQRLGITYQAISNYERGKNSIETDLLFAMCDIYNANPMAVLQSGLYSCPVCGLFYSSDYASDVREHNEFHKTFCAAVEYYGDCCRPQDKWAKMKSHAYDVLDSENSTKNEKVDALLELMKAYFSRSVSAWGYSLDHPKFNDYVAMLLNQERFQNYDKGAYNVLLEQFGKKPGIPEGQTTYKIEEINNRISTKNKKRAPLYSSEAMKLAQDYDGLDTHGQRMVRLVADEEKARCTTEARAAQREQAAAEEKLIRFSVPGYSLPLSAGTGQESGEEYPENYTLVKEPPRGTSFIARVSGNSMEPTYHDGDLVFVHAAEEIPVGKIGAFHMDGQQWVKELGDGVLISHNPAYAPRPTTEDIRCQGLVLGVCDESYFE